MCHENLQFQRMYNEKFPMTVSIECADKDKMNENQNSQIY